MCARARARARERNKNTDMGRASDEEDCDHLVDEMLLYLSPYIALHATIKDIYIVFYLNKNFNRNFK